MASIRIVLADDHDVVRAGIRGVLERIPGVEIVGEADNGRTLIELARRLTPNLVLTDIAMPDLNGLEATRQIVALDAGIRVIVLSMHSSRQFVSEVLKAGASAYILKNTASREVPMAVSAAMDGKIFLSPGVADVVVEDYVRHVPDPGRAAFSTLSAREREVLQLLAEGKTSKEIGLALHVSAKTVESHRAQIMDKLGLRTVAELTKFAIREGLTSLDG